MFNLAKNKLVRKLAIGAALTSTLYFSGCGNDNGITAPGPEPQGDYVLESNVHELGENAIQNFNSESGEIIFSDNQNFSEGDVLISGVSTNTPGGLLRKIESIEGDVAQTSRATLNDAIEECDLQESFVLTPQDAKSVGFNIPINNVVLYDEDGNLGTIDDQITLNGEIFFNSEVRNFELEADNFELRKFVFDTSTDVISNFELDSKIAIPELNQKIKIAPDIPGHPITIGPLVLVPKLALYANLSGKASISSIEFSEQSHCSTGLSYEEGIWQSSADFLNYLNLDSQNFSTESNVKIGINPQMELLVYDFTGAYLGVNGFVRTNVDPQSQPSWQVFGGLGALVGAKIQAFGWNIADYSVSVIDHEELIAQAEELPDELVARLTVTPNSGVAPLEVLLDASESTPQNLINQYSFQFGDGGSYSETLGDAPDGNFDGKTTHVYSEGNFSPRVAIKDDLERISSEASSLIVEAPAVADTLVQLTFGGEVDYASKPVWSPDGSKIAFTKEGSIYIMDAEDGSNQTLLVNRSYYDYCPDWSPDGNKILFASQINQGYDIFMVDIDGTNLINITNTDGPFNRESDPSWSPDGNQMVYTLEERVYKIDIDGTNKIQLTNDDICSDYPIWSPDGNQITYRRDAILYCMGSDGNNKRMLTNEEILTLGSDWAPTGDKIYFSGYDPISYHYDLFQMNVDGSNQVNITNTPDSHEVYLSVSYDGKYVAFSKNMEIYKMNIPLDIQK